MRTALRTWTFGCLAGLVLLPAVALAGRIASPGCASLQTELLNPSTQPAFVNRLPLLGAYAPDKTLPFCPGGSDCYAIQATQFQQFLGLCKPTGSSSPCDPTDPKQQLMTNVWGFGPVGGSGTYPGRNFEAKRGVPNVVQWINDLPSTHLLRNPADGTTLVDYTVHGPTMIPPSVPYPTAEAEVRLVVHNHGAEVRSDSDGFPDFWFTNNPNAGPNGLGGPAGNSVIYTYPNRQPPATLWYHDHTLGITRLNVYSGLEGFYLLRDPQTETALNLPSGPYEQVLLVQDRHFLSDGSLFYTDGVTESVLGNAYHPKLRPEYFGDLCFQDFTLVNGMVWPYMEVEPRRYRFRFLNGSNSRMYNLRLLTSNNTPWPGVYQIGSDGGYLSKPVQLQQTPDGQGYSVAPDDVVSDGDITDTSTKLFLAPAERVDVIIDFSNAKQNQKLTLVNDALAPFPGGNAPKPNQTGLVMQFVVDRPLNGRDTSYDPASGGALNYLPTRLDAGQVSNVRHMILTEVEDPQTGNPAAGLLMNTCWDAPITESPQLGSTEIWEIANLTPDTHPIHLHLVEFNLLNRQQFDRDGYMSAINQANGYTGTVIDPLGRTLTNGGVQIGDLANLSGAAPNCPTMSIPGLVASPGSPANPTYNAGNPGPFAPFNTGLSGNTLNAIAIPDVTPFLTDPETGKPFPVIPPNGTEAGLKDTIRVKHGTVTRFLIKFGPEDPNDGGLDPSRNRNGFKAFDATVGRYPWHCHILEHEDQEMMRPYQVCGSKTGCSSTAPLTQ